MTSPVSPLAQALHLLKVELSQARRGATENKAQAAPRGRIEQLDDPLAEAGALQSLRVKLKAARTQSGGLTRGRALRLFVEAALLDEFGGELQLDPALGDLVDRTCRALEQDTANATLLAEALQELEALAG